MVERNALGIRFRVAEDNPLAALFGHAFDAFPRTVYQNHVAGLHGCIEHIVENIFAVALHGEHVEVEALVEVGSAQGAVDECRFGRDEHFGKAYFVEVELCFRAALLIFVNDEVVRIGEGVYAVVLAEHKERVALLEHRVGLDQFLYLRAEHRLVGASDFEQRDAVVVAYVKLAYRAAFEQRVPFVNLQAKHAVVQVVFLQERGYASVVAFLGSVAILLVKEEFAKRIEEQQAGEEADDTDGREVEEAEARQVVVAQVAVHDEVRRRTDEREHAAHAAGEGEGHHQFGGACAGGFRHGEDNGQQQRHGTRVAHESCHHGGHDHHEEEEPLLVRACEAQQLAADGLGEAGLEHRAAHDEQADHHHYGGVGESGKRLGGRDDVGGKQNGHGAERHNVGAYFVDHKRHDSQQEREYHDGLLRVEERENEIKDFRNRFHFDFWE